MYNYEYILHVGAVKCGVCVYVCIYCVKALKILTAINMS